MLRLCCIVALTVQLAGCQQAPEAVPEPRSSITYIPQAEDGSYVDGEVPVELRRPIGTTSWLTLAMLGEGRTLSAGQHKSRLRRAFTWLLQAQDPQGRFGVLDSVARRQDHVVASLALAEMCLAEPGQVADVVPRLALAMRVIARAEHSVLENPRTAALSRCLVRVVRPLAGNERLLAPLDELERALGVDDLAIGSDPGAATLLRRWNGERVQDVEWPRLLAGDPIDTFLTTVAVQHDKAHLKPVERLVGERDLPTGEWLSWTPRGPDADLGRRGIAGVCYVCMQIRWGICKLRMAAI